LVVGGKGVLVKQHKFRIIRTHLCEVGEPRSDHRDQIRLGLHTLFVGHRLFFLLPLALADFVARGLNQPKRSTFVNCYMLRFVTFDEILWRFTRGVMHVPFEFHVSGDLLYDDSADSPGFGIPSHMVTELECR
jgi:hypothetical protein